MVNWTRFFLFTRRPVATRKKINQEDAGNMEKCKTRILTVTQERVIEIEKYLKWRRLVRTTAYVFRFIRNCREKVKENKSKESLTPKELKDSETYWIRMAQTSIRVHSLKALSLKLSSVACLKNRGGKKEKNIP